VRRISSRLQHRARRDGGHDHQRRPCHVPASRRCGIDGLAASGAAPAVNGGGQVVFKSSRSACYRVGAERSAPRTWQPLTRRSRTFWGFHGSRGLMAVSALRQPSRFGRKGGRGVCTNDGSDAHRFAARSVPLCTVGDRGRAHEADFEGARGGHEAQLWGLSGRQTPWSEASFAKVTSAFTRLRSEVRVL
jgi:hypothetical protein